MKTIKTILITLLFAGFSTFSYAEGKMGLTITGLDANGDAAEMSRGVEQTRSEDIQGAFVSFFIEKDLGPMTVGLDIAPYDIAEGSVTNVRTCGMERWILVIQVLTLKQWYPLIIWKQQLLL